MIPALPHSIHGARRSRHIAAAVRRAVWARDNGQCTFVGTEGHCHECGFLQFHHLEPHALGGKATVERIALRGAARPHNHYEAELEFGSCGPPAARVLESGGGTASSSAGSPCPQRTAVAVSMREVHRLVPERVPPLPRTGAIRIPSSRTRRSST